MAYKFDDKPKVIELTTQNLKYLDQCDRKISGTEESVLAARQLAFLSGRGLPIVDTPLTREEADREIARLQRARKDIVKQLTKEEKATYKLYLKSLEPKALTEEEIEATRKQMNENRDRPSH